MSLRRETDGAMMYKDVNVSNSTAVHSYTI